VGRCSRVRSCSRGSAFLADEAARGGLTLSADASLAAYAIVRVSEGSFYNDAIAAVDPRLDDAVDIVRLIIT
jgi:hypothetical protein